MANPLGDVRKAADALTRAQGRVDAARAELARRIYVAADAGESRSAIARAAGVSRQWISNLLERRG
jgi:DNA-binding XRE family transcriptional regulator